MSFFSSLFGAQRKFGLEQLEAVVSAMKARGREVDVPTLETIVAVIGTLGVEDTAAKEADAEIQSHGLEIISLGLSREGAQERAARAIKKLEDQITKVQTDLANHETTVNDQITAAETRKTVVEGLRALMGPVTTKPYDSLA